MSQVKELRENFGKVVHDLQELAVRVHKEHNGLYTPEAKQTFEKLNAERVRIEGEIESAEIDNQISGIANTVRSKAEEKFSAPSMKGTDFYKKDADTALKGWLLRGRGLTNEQHRNAAGRVNLDYGPSNDLAIQMQPSRPYWQTRTGALEGTNSLGGYTVVPDLLAAEIDVALKSFCVFRDICRVYPTATGGQPLLYPTIDDTSVLAESHAENTADTEQDWTLAQVSVPATTQFSSGVYPISVELLQDSVLPITELIAELIGIRVGRSMASSFTTTLKSDVTTAATTAAVSCTFSDIQTFLWTLDKAYLDLPSTAIMCSQDWIRNAYSLVDSNNRPILNMSMDAINNKAYQTVLGYRVVVNNYLSTVAATNVVAVIGPWERALVRDAGPMNMRVLNERFMDQLAVGVIGWQRSSYKTIRASAFVKQVIHA